MKRFVVFSFGYYDAAGGWTGVDASFDTEKEALAYINLDSSGPKMDCYQILDMDTRTLVFDWSKDIDS